MSETRAAIGVDIGGTKVKGGIVSSKGALLCRVEHDTDVHAGTKSILGTVHELLERSGELGVNIECIGVGAAGFIDSRSGTVVFAANLVYDDPKVAEAVKTRFDLPVVVDNDANAATWGEKIFGTAKGAMNLALLTIGTGIGSGFIVNGELLRGATGAGAEMGHTVVDPSGPLCGCGLKGCFEQLAAGRAIARLAREGVSENPDSAISSFVKSVEDITARDVARAAAGFDEIACRVLRRAGQALGVGMSNVVNIFDPEVIVLGGGIIKVGEPYLGPARDQLVKMTTAQRRRPIRVDVTSLGAESGIIGAAALAFDQAV